MAIFLHEGSVYLHSVFDILVINIDKSFDIRIFFFQFLQQDLPLLGKIEGHVLFFANIRTKDIAERRAHGRSTHFISRYV